MYTLEKITKSFIVLLLPVLNKWFNNVNFQIDIVKLLENRLDTDERNRYLEAGRLIFGWLGLVLSIPCIFLGIILVSLFSSTPFIIPVFFLFMTPICIGASFNYQNQKEEKVFKTKNLLLSLMWSSVIALFIWLILAAGANE